MNTASTSKYFEILSHPTRHSILRFIDVNTRYFSEILKGISTDDEIGSSKLNFHLKKMLELDVLVKNNNIYSVSELGFKLLSLVNYFEEFDSMENFNDIEYKIENLDESTPQDTTQIKKLPMIIRPENLSPLISVFEYFEGKNYEYMEEKTILVMVLL